MTAFHFAGGGLLLSGRKQEGGSAANESGDASPHSISAVCPGPLRFSGAVGFPHLSANFQPSAH